MPSDPNFPDDMPNTPWRDPDEIPASVTFMELMRQAAARANPPRAQAARQSMPAESAPAAPVHEAAADQAAHAAALEAQRIQRVKRRRARRRRQTVGVLGGIIRTFLVVVIAAGLLATIFTWWTPAQFIAEDVKAELSLAMATSQATPVPTSQSTPNWLRRVGVISGHRGPQVPPDPGAVCPDGLTEAEINFAVAQLVVRNLRGRGYTVDLLDEFDPRLDNYQAAALISIHANTCKNFGEVVSGFLIAAAAARASMRGPDEILVDCIARYYGLSTGLARRDGLTIDMTDYHTFREIHPLTPAAIIELGFMFSDRPILTGKQEEMARGITDGVLCFLEPSQLPPTPIPPGDD